MMAAQGLAVLWIRSSFSLLFLVAACRSDNGTWTFFYAIPCDGRIKQKSPAIERILECQWWVKLFVFWL